MIDIHTHILPDLDDGAAGLEETISMANLAVAEGIDTIIATPHHANGRYDNPGSQVRAYVARVQEVLREHSIPLTLLPGQEVRIHRSLIEQLHASDVIALHTSRYILIEFPSKEMPSYTEELFHELLILGMIPIIAHPERNAELASSPGKLADLIKQGALAQMTSHSINGLFGPKIQKLSMELCKQHLIHFVSSDAHNSTGRSFGLQAAYRQIASKLGEERVRFYQDNAERLVRNERIEVPEPVYRRKKWLFF